MDKQEFIVETPIIIEEKLNKDGDKIRKYERGKFLGKGGFAKCYEMKCQETNRIYAAKVFEKKALTNARSKKKLINEIKLHKKLHNQNIVNFEHFFEDKENVYILLELCSNQTLNELLKRRKRLTEIEVQCYLIQIIKALKYIHNHRIIHRDLKLGNLFITNKLELKLGDFGLAARLEYEGQRRRTVCGTPNYIAPEILEKKNGHSFEVDIWSLGVIAYTLIFGKPPFETSDVKLTYKKIKMNSYSFPEHMRVNPSAKKLISSILNLDPSKRPSLDMILEHEFFRIFNSVPVLLPLSTLACPPSQKYIQQFNRNDLANLNLNSNQNHRYNNSVNFNNTFSNYQLANAYLLNDFNDLNKNLNYVENNLSQEFINKLLQSSENPLHRKSESLTKFQDEQLIQKFNQLLQTSNNNNPNIVVSRNLNKNDNFNQIENENPQNIINNNFFINVSNLNNMELKFDQSVIKKLEEIPLNSKRNNLPPNEIRKNIFKSKINKFYDNTNKFGIIYFASNSHICICFNDNSNMMKNLKLEENQSNFNYLFNNKNYEYIYIDKDGKNTLNYDEKAFQNYLENAKDASKDILKKFEIFKHISNKYSNEFKNENNYPNLDTKVFYIKKFLKVQHGFLFRLSNKLIQVNFSDKSELILSTEFHDVYYKNKNEEEFIDSIQNVMNSENLELIKRVKYAKNLLIHFVKSQKSKKVPK